MTLLKVPGGGRYPLSRISPGAARLAGSCAGRCRAWLGRGGALIELVMALSLLGILGASTYSVLAAQRVGLARLHAQWQALALAQSLLAEVQALPASARDPDGGLDQQGPESGEARGSAVAPFDHVNDYDGWVMDQSPAAWDGQPWSTWLGFRASIQVRPYVLPELPAEIGWWVTVQVVAPGGALVLLEGSQVQQP